MSEQEKNVLEKYTIDSNGVIELQKRCGVTDADIQKLHDMYAVFPPIEDNKTLATHKAGSTELRTLRSVLTKGKKDLKGPALKFCNDVEAEYKRLTDEVLKIEEPRKAAQKEYEDKIRAEKEEKERIELERVVEIQGKINSITALPALNEGKTSHEIEEAIEGLSYRDLFDYQEFTSQRDDALIIARESLTELLASTLKRETEEKEAALQKEKEEAERLELETKRQRELEEREKQAEIERKELEAEKSRMAEEDTLRKQEAARLEQEARVEREKLEEERRKIEEAKAEIEREKQARIEAERPKEDPPKNLVKCPHCDKDFKLED